MTALCSHCHDEPVFRPGVPALCWNCLCLLALRIAALTDEEIDAMGDLTPERLDEIADEYLRKFGGKP